MFNPTLEQINDIIATMNAVLKNLKSKDRIRYKCEKSNRKKALLIKKRMKMYRRRRLNV